MADTTRTAGAVPMARRVTWAIGLLAIVALAYGALAFGGLAPWPRSIATLAQPGAQHRGYALVSGYYLAQPFVANGNGLPPYAFGDASTSAHSGASVRVTPTLGDLRAYRVVAVIDLATGDGSEWNPYVIHTVGSVTSVVLSCFVGILVLAALLFWVAGAVAAAAPLGARRSARQPAT